jgi:hypothetical protein
MNEQNQWRHTAAGVLSLIGGALHLSGWLLVGILGTRLLTSFANPDSDLARLPPSTIWLMLLPLIIFSLVAIAGGICSLKGRAWGLSLAGAVCAIFSPGTWMLGVTATVLVAIGRGEYAGRGKPSCPTSP